MKTGDRVKINIRGEKMYYITSKQLDQIKIARPGKESLDPDGWFEDGQRDAKKGKVLNYGCIKLKENINAYVNGYNSEKVI
jgi:hypothetical protein